MINTNIRKEGEYLGFYETPYDVWNVYPNPHEGSFMTVRQTLSVWMFVDGKWKNTAPEGSNNLVPGEHVSVSNNIISVKATSQDVANTLVQRDGYGNVDFNDVEVNTLSDDNDNAYAFPGSSDKVKENAKYILATTDDIKDSELEPMVLANKDAIELLNSDSETAGSVDSKISQALSWEIVEAENS